MRRCIRALIITSALVVVLVPSPAPAATAGCPSAHVYASLPAHPKLSDFFTPAEIARSHSYHRARYALDFSSLVVELIVLVLLGWFLSKRIGARAERVAGGRWWVATIVLAVFATIVPAVVTLPLSIWSHAVDHSYGLSTDSTAASLIDRAKVTGFDVIVWIIAGALFVGIARKLQRAWPIVVAVAGTVLTFALVFLFPLVYEPAFNSFPPADAVTRARVQAIGAREGVQVGSVYVSDASRRTTTQNAYVSGLGATKRVVLYDTLVRGTDPCVLDIVVAHELAHVAHKDVLKGTALGSAGSMAGVLVLWLLLGRARIRERVGAPQEPRAILFLTLFVAVASLVTLPVANAYSRSREAAADKTAIAITGEPEAAIATEVQLARRNIADLTPNGFVRWMFFTHPSTMERIGFALAYRASH